MLNIGKIPSRRVNVLRRLSLIHCTTRHDKCLCTEGLNAATAGLNLSAVEAISFSFMLKIQARSKGKSDKGLKTYHRSKHLIYPNSSNRLPELLLKTATVSTTLAESRHQLRLSASAQHFRNISMLSHAKATSLDLSI